MSMELLAAPHLARSDRLLHGRGGALRAARAPGGRPDRLPHIACVDAFQHWIYTSGEGAEPARGTRRGSGSGRGSSGSIDWTGSSSERIGRWYRQLHVFPYPFYYIEYGIAQLGALQVWRNSLADPAGAVGRYRGPSRWAPPARFPRSTRRQGPSCRSIRP